jgi:outer membrane protein TolC
VGHGFVVSLALPLAFWNPDGPRAQATRAQAARVRAELGTRSHRAERLTSAARTRLLETRAALDELGDPRRDAELSQMASLAFASGEGSLTELLDAYDSETELRLARIDLQWQARQSSIALQHSLGQGVPK